MHFEFALNSDELSKAGAVLTALHYCCPEGREPELDENGVISVELASNADLTSARALVDIVLRETPESPTYVEEARAATIMPDGIPFVLSHF